jgi:nanoRNase/pAp phosphatase (c-di-AMP/oligoRNAs hydrolase)
MNPNQQTLSRLIEVFPKVSAGVILIPTNPTSDAIASATSLYLSLTKMGKTVSLACSSVVKSDLVAVDKFQTNIATIGDNLVMSFPYIEGAIDKVDYNIQGGSFNLIVAPRPGFQKLNPNQVKYSYSGGSIDFLVIIDSPNFNSLGQIYTDNQAQFQGREIINIDRHLTNGFFGSVNFVNKSSSSISEMVLKIIQVLNIDIDKDIATNLYAGLMASTNNFTSYSVNADTFEAASTLLKLGAIKKPIARSMNTVGQIGTTIRPPSFSQKPINAVEQEPGINPDQPQPQDWLKPKIFKNSGLI